VLLSLETLETLETLDTLETPHSKTILKIVPLWARPHAFSARILKSFRALLKHALETVGTVETLAISCYLLKYS